MLLSVAVKAQTTITVCIGADINLYDTGASIGAGSTFAWTGPAGFSSTVQNPVIINATTAMAGTYTVVTNGTTVNTTTVNVVPGPGVPTIPVIFPLCSQNTLRLYANDTTAGVTWYWTGPNGFTSTLQNPTIANIPTSGAGNYYVYASNGNCAQRYFVHVYVDSTPKVPTVTATSTISALCSGNPLYLTCTPLDSGVTYRWEGPDTFSSRLQNPFLDSAFTFNSGTYTVTITKGACSNFATIPVIVNETPTHPDVRATTPICERHLLTMGANSTPATGNWHWWGPSGFTSNTRFPSISSAAMSDSGWYYVYEDLGGCKSDTDSILIRVMPEPVIPRVWSATPVCENSTLRLFALSDTFRAVDYSWQGPLGFTSLMQNPTIPGVTTAASGLYTVTASIGDCSTTNQTLVNITPAPSLVITSNSPVCSGDTLKLVGTSGAGNTFSWVGPYSYTAGGARPNRPHVTSEDAGVYRVTVTDVNGCTTVGYDTVVVNQTPVAPWVQWMKYCQHAHASPLLNVQDTGITWYSTNTGGTPSRINPIPNTDTNGVFFYYLSETTKGCKSPIDSVQVIVYPVPHISMTPSSVAVCPHTAIQYTTTSDGNVFNTYRWFPSYYVSDSTDPNAVATPVSDITYTMVTTNEFNCTDSEISKVKVYPAAVVNIGLGDTISIYEGQSIHFNPQTNCTGFLWFPQESADQHTISDPTVTPQLGTMYIVTATSEYGCVAYDSVFIKVTSQGQIHIPNAFTPDGSTNQIFKIIPEGLSSLNHFRIFDRWGNKVFETSNLDEGWDGSLNGAAQPTGVYVYDIQAVSNNAGHILNKTGNVTLIR